MTETSTTPIKGVLHQRLTKLKPPKPVLVSLLVILGVTVLLVGAASATQYAYRDRIYPHVSIAGVDVGGLDTTAALQKVQKAYNAMIDKGLHVRVGGSTDTIPLSGNSEDVVFALIDVDIATEVENAYQVGRNNGLVTNATNALLFSTFLHHDSLSTATIDEARLKQAIRTAFPNAEDSGSPTDYVITPNSDTYDVRVTPAVQGTVFAFGDAFAALNTDLQDFSLNTLQLSTENAYENISVSDAEKLIPTILAALNHAPYTLSHTPQTRTSPITWEISKDNLIEWLIPAHNDDSEVVLSLDAEKMKDLLAAIHAEVDVDAQDAKFVVENDRVIEFTPSQAGLTVNDAQTIRAAEAFLGTDNTEILVAVDRVEPEITTAESNNLGIADLLGQGYSAFKGSPTNRIGNIQHGAEKLNGLLFAPGEIVSLGAALSPITIEDGYLPEMVIKGDEILPEVGGGLCQIGTTTFRAAMNSGLKIVERRNHSLVVSYYNDPSNGLPGTDATIYEPVVDLKFQNDTANYIMLTTEVDMETKELFFTFWGTDDGRQGSYEPPQVLSRTSAGATVYKETDSLAPGVEKCQNGFNGAVTTFTYTVVHADGTVVEQEFPSTYRSLPRICLVGKADAAEEASTEESATEAEISEPTT